jgi:hypothetical protein
MAEMDPVSIAQAGVDPVTGSPLSSEVRKALFRRSSITSSSVFGGGGALLPINRRSGSSEGLSIVKSNQESLVSIQQQINSIRTDIVGLNSALNGISSAIQTTSSQDNARLLQEQENERRLDEQNIRAGKEKDLERRIQAKATQPVQQLAPKLTSIFDRIKESLSYLFVGWLTNQGVEALKALEEGNTKKLEEIKFNILKNLGYGVTALSALKFGVGGIIRVVTGITSKVVGLLGAIALKPFQAAGAAIKSVLPGGKPTATPSGKPPTKPGGGRSGPAGGLGTGLQTGIEAFQGNWLEAGLGAAAFLPGLPGKAAKGAFWLEQGLDLFGKGVIPEKQTAAPQTKPQQSMMGKPAPAAAATPQPSQTPSASPAPMQMESPSAAPPPTPAVQQPAPTVSPQTSMTPQSSDLSLNVDTSKAFSLDKSLVDFSIKPEYGTMDMSASVVSGNASDSNKGSDVPKMKAVPSPAQTQTPSKPQMQVGPLPEPKPDIIMAQTGNAQSQQNVPVSTESSTNVPLINSSNPDNFYVLYSQLQYNVVT